MRANGVEVGLWCRRAKEGKGFEYLGEFRGSGVQGSFGVLKFNNNRGVWGFRHIPHRRLFRTAPLFN